MTELVDIFIRPLVLANLDYFVTGSVAAMIYGEPRLTNDIDLVLTLEPSATDHLARIFPESDYYLPPADVLRIEAVRSNRGHFNILHLQTMLKADVYFAGMDTLNAWAFERKRIFNIEDLPVAVAPAEYVILRKLMFFQEGKSEKHLRDIAAMLRESADEIDMAFITSSVTSYGLAGEWERARQFR